VRDRLIRERALVEGSIGTIKCNKYGFNRPAARSAAMMGLCGQRAVLGLNLTKLLRAPREGGELPWRYERGERIGAPLLAEIATGPTCSTMGWLDRAIRPPNFPTDSS